MIALLYLAKKFLIYFSIFFSNFTEISYFCRRTPTKVKDFNSPENCPKTFHNKFCLRKWLVNFLSFWSLSFTGSNMVFQSFTSEPVMVLNTGTKNRLEWESNECLSGNATLPEHTKPTTD